SGEQWVNCLAQGNSGLTAGPGVFFNNNSILSGGGKGLLPEGDAAEAARSPYSIPGILHFLQHEWARFDVEKVQWELQRAELQAQIAFLQGERKGQENLKKDLVRRIKMLEYALKQERSKYHKLKYGTELNQGDVKPPNEVIENETPGSLNNQLSWKQGRQLLRQYLQEVGYADTILDVKSRRVQTLLCLAGDGGGPVERTANGTDTQQSESSVVQEAFRFIESSAADYSDEDDDEDGSGNDRTIMERTGPTGTIVRKKPSSALSTSMDTSEDPDTEDALKGFDFLSSPDDMDTSPESRSAGNGTNWGPNRSKLQDMLANLRDQEDMNPREPSSTSQSRSNAPRLNDHHQDNNTDEVEVLTVPPSSGKAFILGPDVNMEAELGLGELAGLTVSNEADSLTYDMSNNKDALRRTWNPKFTLRSHFDGIRGLAFHPVEAVLVTASEDHTLKMWNLQKTSPTKKNASVDVEPMHTFRAHQGAVLCVVMSSTGEQCFSGGLDGTIQSWNTPNPNLDPYDSYEPSVLRGALCGHTDSVWGLVYSGVYQRLLSCSGDGTVRLWDASDTKPALVTFRSKEFGVPSSVDVVSSDPAHMVTSFTSGQIGLFNMETQQLVLSTPCQINKVLSHPTLPITITAEEDKHIKFYDNNTGKLVHSMVAHLDAVTSLAVDPNGLYLMSGSHDCSIRLWNLETKTCVQEFTAHRKKNDESIHDVAFHPSKAYIASAGADALAKVFV
uniref:Striatin N-terminal domain-containing protein n=1 Tax=Oncorhynchus mykiss TaxID=8022 RepID=A0A8C7QE52_ONCMY